MRPTQLKPQLSTKPVGLALLLSLVCSGSVWANQFALHPSYAAFKIKTQQRHGLTAEQIDQAMDGTQSLSTVLRIMNTPGESKPWYAYKSQFLSAGTIQRGKRFQQQYAEQLNRAEQQFGVPQAIILGILGVETGFGANKGNFKSRDALATLAFDGPRRNDYFADELAALLAWTHKEGFHADQIAGSYAGAMGYPQFMPSNITKFGVDYDGNGHIELRSSATDAIGSIANYLAQNGWQRDRPIGFAANYYGNDAIQVIAKDLTQPVPYGRLQQLGVNLSNAAVNIDDLDLVNLIELKLADRPIYYVTYPNFQVITTYNRSRMYAAAVWQLGIAVTEE